MNKVDGNNSLQGAISNLKTRSNLEVKDQDVKSKRYDSNPKNVGTSSGYNVNLSDTSKSLNNEFKRAFEIAKASPDIRQSKIDSIKKRIRNGSYEIDSGKIADGMLREAIKDRLASDASVIG